MMNYIDLVAVDLDDGKRAKTVVCIAPHDTLKVGDLVNTEMSEFGEYDGTVLEVTSTWRDDSIMLFLLRYNGLPKVLNVARKLIFEEGEE